MTALRRFLLKYVGWITPRLRDLQVTPFTPPSVWRIEFYALQSWMINAGLTVSPVGFDEIRWYLCDEIPVWFASATLGLNGPTYHSTTVFAGMWLAKDKAIVLLPSAVTDRRVVLHEMTHAIAANGAPHTKDYFRPEWGNYTGEQPL